MIYSLTEIAQHVCPTVCAFASNSDTTDIVQQAGQNFSDTITFLSSPGNFQLAMCAAAIFIILSLFIKGAGKILNVLVEAVALLVVIYVVLIAFGIDMDIPTFLTCIRDGINRVWMAVTGA